MNYDHIVSSAELEKIFRNNYTRSIFISGYDHFGRDGNEAYYQNFINDNINNKKYKLQEDAIELSLATSIFNTIYLDPIAKIIHSRRTAWIKLLCLDWLNHFAKEVPTQLYTDLNKAAQRSHDELLKIQALLNLSLFSGDAGSLERSITLLENSSTPTIYYRYINNLLNQEIVDTLPDHFYKKIAFLVESSTLVKTQKQELLLRIPRL